MRYVEKVRGSGRFVEVSGAPDLVVEVTSRSSVRKDNIELAKRYFKAGVREYWTIDARGKTIDFRLFVRGQRKFKQVTAGNDGYVRSEVLGGSFHVTRERNEVGHWEYRLLS
ncbi:MAG TPA: Uma2 family endonuclease [Pirellulales bacterium]